MIKGFAKVSSKSDKSAELKKALKTLSKTDVLVGIPEGDEGKHKDITNAELMYVLTHGVRSESMREEMQPQLDSGVPYSKAHQMYIHEHGSPLWHTPPRPVLEPAIEHNKDIITKQLKKTAVAALDDENPVSELEKAGMLGVNVAQDWFTNPNNNWPPNAPSTVLHKLRKDKSSIAKSVVKHVDEGGKLSDITGLTGMTNPNIDTDELRKSITYVVKSS